MSVLAVDYRLVPEHTVADAIDDGVDACRWLLDRGVTDIVLAGDSAGGGLAVSVATRARDDGLPPLAGLVLFSPWARRGPAAPAADSFLTPRCIARVLRLCGAAPGSPDLHDLPPALILAGGRELLAADSHWLAQRFRDAGVSCELQVWPGQGHVFPLLRALPESAAALTEVARFLTTRAVEVARRR